MYNSCFISSRFMRKFFAAGGLSSISITASVRVRRATFFWSGKPYPMFPVIDSPHVLYPLTSFISARRGMPSTSSTAAS